jgi:hypothetical protein
MYFEQGHNSAFIFVIGVPRIQIPAAMARRTAAGALLVAQLITFAVTSGGEEVDDQCRRGLTLHEGAVGQGT